MAEFEILEAESAELLFGGFCRSVPGMSHAPRAGDADRVWREGGMGFVASWAGGEHGGALLLRIRRAVAKDDRVPEGREFSEHRYFRAEKSGRRSDDRPAGFRAF